jgi:tRNA(fMet)-specific endonuclease VapC
LIDSNIIIYSLKNDAVVKNNFAKNANSPKALSVITYGELVFGAHRSQQVTRNMAVVRRISALFPIIEASPSIMETYAEIKAALYNKGKPSDDMDLIIAATALVNNFTLVTNSERHFSEIQGLKIENWTRK